MNKQYKNILKSKFMRIFYIKHELKKIILKSIQKNRKNSPGTVNYINYNLSSQPTRSSITKQLNVCLLRGRMKGNYKLFHLSRHAMTKLGSEGALQNLKVKSW